MENSTLSILNLVVYGDEDDESSLSKLSLDDQFLLRLMIKDNDTVLPIVNFVSAIPNLSNFGYWTLLGALYIHGGYSQFVTVDNWRQLLSADVKCKENIMKPFERRALSVLPNKVECYRIHHTDSESDWISYTISEHLIPKFVEQYKEHDAYSYVEKFVVKKKYIDFFFGRNGEDEIVVLDRSKVKSLGRVESWKN